jgi:hypothetical protein
VSKESKVLIGVGALVVIGLILALIGQPTIGVIAVLIGLVAGVAGLRFTKQDASDPFADARTEADLSNTGTLTPNDGLAPWSPDGGLNAWTPPTDLATSPPVAPTYEAPVQETPTYEAPTPTYEPPAPTFEAPTYASLADPETEVQPAPATSWDDGWDSTVSWAPEAEAAVDSPTDFQQPAHPQPDYAQPDYAQPDYAQPDYAQPEYAQPGYQQADLHGSDSNPLDDLVGLDSLDPIAEVERIEGRSTSLFGGDPTFQAPIINEQVSTADDIMAASQATELNLGDGGEQTELQKLLAKVQIRLSAYE